MKVKDIPVLRQKVLNMLPVLQSEVWKKLDLSSREGSELIEIMLSDKLIKRKAKGKTFLIVVSSGGSNGDTSEEAIDIKEEPSELQKKVLGMLPITQSDLWKKLNIDSSSCSELIRKMADKKLIKRTKQKSTYWLEKIEQVQEEVKPEKESEPTEKEEVKPSEVVTEKEEVKPSEVVTEKEEVKPSEVVTEKEEVKPSEVVKEEVSEEVVSEKEEVSEEVVKPSEEIVSEKEEKEEVKPSEEIVSEKEEKEEVKPSEEIVSEKEEVSEEKVSEVVTEKEEVKPSEEIVSEEVKPSEEKVSEVVTEKEEVKPSEEIEIKPERESEPEVSVPEAVHEETKPEKIEEAPERLMEVEAEKEEIPEKIPEQLVKEVKEEIEVSEEVPEMKEEVIPEEIEVSEEIEEDEYEEDVEKGVDDMPAKKLRDIPALRKQVLEMLPIMQSEIWKKLDIDRRGCSRLINDMIEQNLIKKTKIGGTYLIEGLNGDKAPKKDFSALLSKDGKFSPCCGCEKECEPIKCSSLIEWTLC